MLEAIKCSDKMKKKVSLSFGEVRVGAKLKGRRWEGRLKF